MTAAVIESASTTRLSSPARFYKPELDTLRFFAFLSVYVAHTMQYPVDFLVQHHVPRWVAEAGFSLVHAGWFGVDVFFMLSAYLITALLLRERETRGEINVRAFYLRRILRIWPLYYLVLPLTALIPFFNPDHQFSLHYLAPFLLFAGNWSFVAFGWPSSVAVPLWSVSVEEQFYLLWPPLLARLSRRQIVKVAVVLICVANLGRMLAVAMHQNSLQLWANTFAHMDSIAVGMFLAASALTTTPLSNRMRAMLVAAGACCLAVRGHFVALQASEQITYAGTLAGYSAVVLGSAAILVAFIGSPFRSRVFEYLGKISYGLYVYHLIGVHIAYSLLPTTGGLLHASAWIPLALAITIAIAAVSYAVVEKPFLNLKRRFTCIESRYA